MSLTKMKTNLTVNSVRKSIVSSRSRQGTLTIDKSRYITDKNVNKNKISRLNDGNHSIVKLFRY